MSAWDESFDALGDLQDEMQEEYPATAQAVRAISQALTGVWQGWLEERRQGHVSGHSGDGSPAGDKPGA